MDKVTKKRRGNEGVEYERAICKGGRAVLAYLYRDAEFLVMPPLKWPVCLLGQARIEEPVRSCEFSGCVGQVTIGL